MKSVAMFAGATLAGAMLCGSAFAAPQYTIRALDLADGQTDVYANGINNSGQIVGYTVDDVGNSHAALWDASGAHHPLPELSTIVPFSEAYRINNNGQIVGLSENDADFARAVVWNTPNSVTEIGTLTGAGISFANDINDNGIVVGSSTAEHGQHAFTWTPGGGFVDNGSTNPTSNQGYAGWNGINNNGKLVGTAYILFSPFKASMGQLGDTQPTVISPQAQFSTGMALAVNDAGTIVGYQNPNSGSPHPAIFNGDGTWQDLGTLGLGEGWAEDINENGLIVGRVMGDDGTGNFVQRAMFYQDGQQYELLSEIADATGWTTLFNATGVNDLGQMVGVGIYNGEIRAFVATPVPEPTGLAVIACGAGAMLARRRRAGR